MRRIDKTDILAALDVQAAEDRAVAAADPLECDGFFATRFVPLNADRAAAALAAEAARCAGIALALHRNERIPALASLRDLGMLAASLRHADAEPRALALPLRALARLGRLVDEVPRDTVFSYGPRNPTGARERRFTATPEERVFIDSFRRSVPAIADAIRALWSACDTPLDGRGFAEAIDSAAASLRHVVEQMVEVRMHVSAAVFSGAIRPFFAILEIGGREYVAPGGAQLPLLAVDMMAWADHVPQIQLYRYLRENVDYMPRAYRRLLDDLEGRPSLLRRLSTRRARQNAPGALEALDRLMAQLEKFRFPHRKVTRDNLRVRAYGTFQSEVLDQLLENTVAARARVKAFAAKDLSTSTSRPSHRAPQ